MLYQLRRADGTPSPYSKGTLVAADGTATPLPGHTFSIEVLDRWQAPDGGALYPARWRLQIRAAGEDLALEVVPRLANQELHAAVRYWEGAVEVRAVAGEQAGGPAGEPAGEPVGRGYVELTGYARTPGGGETRPVR
jgi:predicted secreted hydrolase